jgi:hypothetical protein
MTENPAGWIQPAPKQLAVLAAAMRGWDYEDIRTAIIAAHAAGWEDDRIYRETFRLLLREDASPADLRQAARNPTRPVSAPAEGTFASGLASVREAYENRRPILSAKPGPGDVT